MRKARYWLIHCKDDQWGNRLMQELAMAKLQEDSSLDFVTVYEHAGWSLSWNRDGRVVGTANDMAVLPKEVLEWRKQFNGCEMVGYTRDDKSFFFDGYYPKLAEVA